MAKQYPLQVSYPTGPNFCKLNLHVTGEIVQGRAQWRPSVPFLAHIVSDALKTDQPKTTDANSPYKGNSGKQSHSTIQIVKNTDYTLSS